MTRRAQKSIFDSPSIVKLINAYLNSKDGACLARSSRQLFQTIMPLLWERVEGLGQIFALLPANDTKNEEGQSQTLTENDLSRFNVYAFWIKQLEVCKNYKTPKYVPQSNALSRYSATRTLLPNITSISSTCSAHSASISWVLPFLSPSLIRLEFFNFSHICHPELAMVDSLALLHVLSETCPKLQKLAFHPDPEDKEPTPHAYALERLSGDSKSKFEDQLRHGLGSFITNTPPLVSLASSDVILDGACFETISTWPLLESLAIDLGSDRHKYELPKFGDTAFPSLKRLVLNWVPDSKTFKMFWNAPALVKKLTSVNLLLSGDLCSEKGRFNHILLPMIETLAERSPHLEDLWLYAVDPDAMRAWYSIPMPTLEVLKKVPLRRLYIEGVDLRETASDEVGNDKNDAASKGAGEAGDKDNDGDQDEDKAQDEDDEDEDDDEPRANRLTNVAEPLAAMFPILKELSLPRQQMRFTELVTLQSKMPQLEILRFDFDLCSIGESKVDFGSIPRHRSSSFRVLEANFLGIDEHTSIISISNLGYNDIASFVQYIFSLWPNVQIAALPDPDGPDSDEHSENEKAIALVNEHLAGLSYCNRDPSVRYKDIKILNETSWKNYRK
ncbi:hypothetical protein FRC12_001708 [Ceratobasidium sp. 428]|nr:hypothetical protein FRC12_001708 [Ceratobasidium sp. 428]